MVSGDVSFAFEYVAPAPAVVRGICSCCRVRHFGSDCGARGSMMTAPALVCYPAYGHDSDFFSISAARGVLYAAHCSRGISFPSCGLSVESSTFLYLLLFFPLD